MAFGELFITFFDDQFVKLLLATLLLFIVGLITWAIYRKLAKKDLFILARLSGEKKTPTKLDHALYILKYFFLFPLYSFIGFLLFSLSLFVLAKPSTIEQETTLLFISIVLVSAIRVSAYVSEHLAEDLGKLIPLSMLAILLTSPNLSLQVSGDLFTDYFKLFPSFLKYLVFTILLEWILRFCSYLYRITGKGKE